METIKWKPDMSVGVKEIDEQHKEWIKIIDSFYEAFNNGVIDSELGKIIKRIIEYTDFHFATEEKYFDKFNYEFKDEHKVAHQDLRVRILDFQKQFDKDGDKIVSEFEDFLTDWLVRHLEYEDHKYVKCFHDHGLY